MKTVSTILTAVAVAFLLVGTSFADSRDWSLPDIQGNTFKLSDNLGKPTLLIFWATWCAPCKKEMADRAPLFTSFEEKGVNVVLVAVDTPKSQAKVKPYIESKGYTWRTLLDTNQELMKRYGGSNPPYTVLLNGKGEPVYKVIGALKDIETLNQKVAGALGAQGE